MIVYGACCGEVQIYEWHTAVQDLTGEDPAGRGAGANEQIHSRRQVQCLVQLHMWMLLMAHTERILGSALDTDMRTLVKTWQANLDHSEFPEHSIAVFLPCQSPWFTSSMPDSQQHLEHGCCRHAAHGVSGHQECSCS